MARLNPTPGLRPSLAGGRRSLGIPPSPGRPAPGPSGLRRREDRGGLRNPMGTEGQRRRGAVTAVRYAPRRSRSSPSFSIWLPFRRPHTRSTKRYREPSACSRPTAASRCSAGPTMPGLRSASSKTRNQPTSTCSACSRRKQSGAGASGPSQLRGPRAPAGPAVTATVLACRGRRRPPQETFRSTYGAESYPKRPPIRLGFI
jgi:hypothetical protein